MDEASVRILLVDDEPPLLRLMQTYLKKLGYTVEACLDGRSATAAFDAAGGAFDLLVADVTLPDISGKDLAVQLAASQPKLRVLLCSGYPVQLNGLPDNLRDRFGALDKPFVPNMLASSVEKLLRKK
jgi:two-component system cell cycle sensor histidine kinase/response regulator CckA